MAIVLVQSAQQQNNGTAVTVSLSATLAGNLLVAEVNIFAPSSTPVTVIGVTDTDGHAFTQVSGAVANQGRDNSDIWYKENCAAGETSIIVTISSTGLVWVSGEEYSGVATSGSLDSGQSLSQASAATVGPSITPTIAGELLVSTLINDNNFISSVSAPWTTTRVASTGDGFGSGHYINAPLSAQACVFNGPATTSYASSAASFKPPASGPSGKKKGSMNLVL